MACNLALLDVVGVEDPLTQCLVAVNVRGTAQDCERVKVILELDGDPLIAFAPVNDDGAWRVAIDTRVPDNQGCRKCGMSYRLTLSCDSGGHCDVHENGVIECERDDQPGDDCPQLVFNNASAPGPCDANGRRSVRFFASIATGNVGATVRFVADNNPDGPAIAVPANALRAEDHAFDLRPGAGENVRLVVDAPNDCDGIVLPVPELADCPDEPPGDCPRIDVHDVRVAPDCVDGEFEVELSADVTAGDALCVVEWRSGNPDDDAGAAEVLAPGARQAVAGRFRYPAGQAWQAHLHVVVPEGCEDVAVPVGPLPDCDGGAGECPDAADFRLEVIPRVRNCIPRGQFVSVEVRDAEGRLPAEGAFTYAWTLDGAAQDEDGHALTVEVGQVARAVLLEVRREGCEAVPLETRLEACDCPPHPDRLIIRANREPESRHGDRRCYPNRDALELSFALEGDPAANVLAGANWRLYRRDGEQLEAVPEGVLVSAGASARVDPGELASGDYSLFATIFPAPGCPQDAVHDFFVCPKGEIDCPGIDVQADVDAAGNATIRVTIAPGEGLEYARENGFELDFGDGSGADIAGDDEQGGGVWVIPHRYAGADAPYVIRASFPDFGRDCGAGTELGVAEPEDDPDDGGRRGGGGGGDCGFFDFSCWSICGALARTIATMIVGLLIGLLMGWLANPLAITIASASIALTIGLYFGFRCPACGLGTSILTAVAAYLLVLGILSAFGAALPGLLPSLITAGGFAAMGAGLRAAC